MERIFRKTEFIHRAAMTLLLLLVTSTTVWAQTSASYRAYNAGTKTYETRTANSCTAVTAETTTMGTAGNETWYVVNSNVTVNSRIEVCGTVNLILADGFSLTASQGLHAPNGVTLNIFGQSSDTGQLSAAWADCDKAGIGGNNNEVGGTITIHGGHVSASTGGYAAGLGGGVNGNGGHITIYGGYVTASSGCFGAGIGGGRLANCGNVTIVGGTIIATAGTGASYDDSKAIGAGYYGSGGNLNIDNMKVYESAEATEPVAPIYREQTCSSKYARLMPCTAHNYANGVCTICGSVLNNGDAGTYLAYQEATNSFVELTANNPIDVNESTTTFGAAGTETWYIVNGIVTVNSRITVNGSVHLILSDGSKLTVNGGIHVSGDNSLSIYWQRACTGQLIADASGQNECAGIGGGSIGNITIHGANITATGGTWSAGIGGGVNGGGGSITIYNGNVEGIGKRQNNNGNAVGIGHGSSGGAVDLQAIDGMRFQYYDNGWHDVTYSQRASALGYLRVRFFLCTAHSFSDERCIYCGKHQWYTVTYNGNGFTDGSVPTDATHYANDGSGTFMVLGNMNNMARTGYIFSGWNTKADGSGINLAPGATSNIYGNVTLYAKWIPITYTVRFHKNHDDATGTMSDQTFTYDATQALTTNTFACNGYQFTGWSTTASGSPTYTNEQSVSNLGNEQGAVIDLYAVWSQNLYTITYNLNGGTVASSNPTTYSELNQNITLVNPTKEGYDFMGWTGTGLSGATMTVTIPRGSTGNRSYTATWGRYYRAYNTSTKKFETKTLGNSTTLTTVTSGTTSMGTSGKTTWFVVGSNVTVSSRINISGTVNLILRDGAKLTVPEGITVQSGNTLNIYGQNAGTGTLYATSTGGNHAAIGARGEGNTLGIVNIHGGTITAIGGSWSAGIGGGVNSGGGTVNIYGGSVYAEGHDGTSEAIGKGSSGANVSKTLADGLSVKVNNDWTPLGKSDRLSGLSQKVVRVEVCTSHNMSGGSCTYCGSTTCRVIYYSNRATSGTAPIDLNEYKVNTTVTVLGNINNMERAHYTFAGWNTKMDGSGIDYAPGTTFKISGPVYLYAKWIIPQLELSSTADNSNTISQAVGNYYDVTLANHTLYRNGDWNTLVLPFSVASFRGTPLEGATVKTLASTTYSNNKLTLNFSGNLNSIEAGKPYIVKWTTDGLGADLIIHSTDEWNTFASNVNNGTNSYEGKVVKLAADISVSMMVGTNSAFKGTFDGCGHTLTVNLNSSSDFVAPFRYVIGATIRNLIVAGSINGGIHCSGLIGGVNGGSITIENCDVRAAITCSASHCGGYIGHAGSGVTTISNSRFSGSITGGSQVVNIFQGWSGSNTLANCLAAGTYTNCGSLNLKYGSGGVSNCYKTQNIGDQGTYTTATGETLRNSLGDGWVVSGNNVVPKMANSIGNLVNPVFTDVGINDAVANIATEYVDFVGSYCPVTDGSLLLDAHNTNGNAMHAALCPYTSSGYTLNGWYTDAGMTHTTSTIPFADDGSVTLYSTRSLATFSIAYNLGGGSVATANPTSYTVQSNAITLNNPTRNGYAFAGWTGTGINGTAMTVTIPHGSTGNRSYTATWVPSYTITYDLDGGTASNPTNYSVLSEAITLINPTRSGYTFAGWTGTGLNGPTMTVTIPKGSEGNRSYTATWTLNVYTISYDLAGGSVETDNPVYYTSANETVTLVNPTREGYDFAGWTGSNGNTPQITVTIPKGSTGNRSYTANWAFIYSISYDGLEEGTFPSTPPTTYSAVREVTLVNPVRELYDFAGWTGTDLTQPTVTVTIPKGSTGDRTYHATWSLKESIFISYNTETGEYETHGPSNPILLESTSATEIGTAAEVTWYFVKNAGVIASERLTVRGTVNLILADGASLSVPKGITVHSGNTLNIYGQAGGTGSLIATTVSSGNAAAIGTENNEGGDKILGTITIHGGNITATNNTSWSAGIGGGVGCGGGSIAIYGGTVNATASSDPDYGLQEAIGKGSSGASIAKTLADGLCVCVGNNTAPVSYANRIGSLSNKVVKVKPCTEHNWDGGQCTYCGAYQHHQIIYDGNGYTDGDVPEDATFDVDGIIVATGTVAEAGTMERTGYTFTGWNTEADGSGTAYEPGATVTLRSNLTLYAQWTLEEYSITYDLAGGTLPNGKSNPTTYTSESDDITLVNPIREGYAFIGWTGTDLDDVTEKVTIYSGWKGNRTYTATWLGLPPEVSLVENSLTPYGATVKWTGSSESYTLQYAEGDPFIVLFSEGFEGGSLPKGWTTSGPYWAVGSGTGHDDYTGAATGNYNATCYINDYNVEDYLITPVLDLSGAASATLTFNYRNVDWGGDLNELHVYYRVDGDEWSHLYSNTDEVSDWTLVTIPLEGLAANYQIGFKCYSHYGYGMGIDDVQVLTEDTNFAWTTVDNAHSPYTFDDLELETTYSVRVIGVTEGQDNKMSNIFSFTTLGSNPKPFGFDIVENTLTPHSATVSWKGFSDSYNIRLNEDNSIVRADFETGDLNQADFTTTDDYPWTVVKNDHSGSWCAKSASGYDGETSALEIQVTLEADRFLTFSAKVSSEGGYDKAYFSIDETEEDETKEIDGISGDGEWIDYLYPLTAGTHTLRWYYVKDGGDSANDDCFYVDNIRIANENDMTSLGTYNSSTTNYNFTNLDAEKTYLVQVQGVKENVTTDWSEPYAFTTATSCPKPTDLIAGTPDAHSVELNWTENGTATQWQICVNGDMSNLMTVSTNPYTLSGLSGDTDYAVKVRAYNNANEQSRWSNVVTFTTDIACFAPSDLTIGAISSRSVELSWTENDSSNKWVIEYSTDDEFTDAKSVEVTGTPSHTLTALTSGYTYYVHVRAINSDYELSRWSEYECFDAKQVIGDGGSDTNDNLPLNTDRKYSLSQQIYTASELGEAGFIESIDFYADCYATRNIDIYMVSTSKSSFESGTDWVAVTASELVFSGEVQFNNDGWKTITLDRYFEYDGTNNIVLVVDDNTGSNTYNYYHAFHVFDATNQAIYVNGSSDYDPFNPSSGTVLDVKNQTRLAISVSPKPTDVTATDIAATSATISWNGEGGNYDVKYREATVSSTWLSEALFFENFEDGLGNWTRYAAGYSGSSTNWQPINPLNDKQTFQYISAYSRNYVAMSRSNVGTAVDNWLVTPPMTLGDVLKFHAHDDGTHHEHFEVYVSTKTKAISDFEKVADPSIDNGSWNEITVDLSAYAGQEGYIAIRHNDTGKNFLFIDDFGVYETIYDYTYGTETTITCTTNSCELTGLSAGKKYEVQVRADCGAEGTSQWSDPIIFDPPFFDLILANAADNSDAISMAATNGGEFNVTLAGRTLWKDGDWNTLCLPFDLGDPQAEEGHYFDGTLLEGATVKTLKSTDFSDGTLTMNFVDVQEIAAGTPFLVKWTSGENEVNPVFTGVTITNNANSIGTDYVNFIGTYAPVTYAEEDRSVLFMGSGSNLYYPDGRTPITINACRAYFTLNDITAGDPESGGEVKVKGFVLNFGEEDDDATAIKTIGNGQQTADDAIYNLAGQRLNKMQKGINIVNGKKILK